MNDEAWPRPLEEFVGPHPEEKITGVAASMGDHGLYPAAGEDQGMMVAATGDDEDYVKLVVDGVLQ